MVPSCHCGKEATNFSRDLIETEPVRDAKGQLWATWKGGTIRYGCNDHLTRKSRNHNPDGTFQSIPREQKYAESVWKVRNPI